MVRNLGQIIDWAIREESTIGYFAVLYKRSTVAIRAALDEGLFCDRPQMEQFDAVFAKRYFDALNAYFCPDDYDGLTLPWEVALVRQELGQSTMLQHMVAGLNAHINFDLGLATAEMVPYSMDAFEHDFQLINALVATQIRGMLRVTEGLSPAVLWIRRAVPNEIGIISRVLIKFRKSGWLFAIGLAMNHEKAREKTVNQMSWAAALGAWYLDPPRYFRLIPRIVDAIATRENHNIATHLEALDKAAFQPDPLDERYLDRRFRNRSLIRKGGPVRPVRG
ncbi:DUF5995 family protein [Mycolicibacterium sp. ND9-15]|uniref:DUF5995 family protein n=1 Tax=Mycolicibacterium sp. ND9-15 TaxID=3042320 RepID=UPI002DD8A826|nr:DUF5995 family protein [Mycolicibacterium sp. ND9-15]WSE56638.1 DUF5995 family protein [Mycolicibacterium sp. ND9-15]